MPNIKQILSSLHFRKITLKFVFSDSYWMVDLKNHVFPVKKYRLIYERLLSMGARKENFIPAERAAVEDLLLVHSSKYVRKVQSGRLSQAEKMLLELPYSPELFDFGLLHVGGTIQAARIALQEGIALNLGGGFHHAFEDHGEGFCVFNDVAVAVEKCIREGRIGRAMVVDCDVHQGNGTAAIFSGREDIFTFSIHQMDLYPARKSPSSLDVELWSGDGDAKYLSLLRNHFPRLYKEFRPDVVFFLAGADPYERDQLGGLNLSVEGLKERGRIVVGEARKLKIPVVILLAGGYAFDVEDTVGIHLNTIKTAQKIHRRLFFKIPKTAPAPPGKEEQNT